MKTLYWTVAGISAAFIFAAACAPKTGNYKMVHMDSVNAQQSLDQSVQTHP